jgi:hypothetical protein
MIEVNVDCQPVPGGWSCAVDVVEGASRSRHTVDVKGDDLARLDPTATEPKELVRRSFDFLLRRESKESILASFDLMLIARYFPEYETEIGRRV